MHEINHHLNQLPNAVRLDVQAHAGHTAAMAPAQLVAHYRAVAKMLIEQKRSRYEPLLPGDEMSRLIADLLYGNDLSFVSGSGHEPFPRWITFEIIKALQGFINKLAPVQAKREQEAHQRAVQAEAERRRAQEEAVRRQAQQKAEAVRLAAEQAARKLAQQKAEAAARALAKRKADEAALLEASVALKVAPSKPAEKKVAKGVEKGPAREILFIPGPAAMADIDRATLVLKQSVDAAVTLYASKISPHLNSPKVSVNPARGLLAQRNQNIAAKRRLDLCFAHLETFVA